MNYLQHRSTPRASPKMAFHLPRSVLLLLAAGYLLSVRPQHLLLLLVAFHPQRLSPFSRSNKIKADCVPNVRISSYQFPPPTTVERLLDCQRITDQSYHRKIGWDPDPIPQKNFLNSKKKYHERFAVDQSTLQQRSASTSHLMSQTALRKLTGLLTKVVIVAIVAAST